MGSGASHPSDQPITTVASYPRQTQPSYLANQPPSYATLSNNSRPASSSGSQAAYPVSQPPYSPSHIQYPSQQSRQPTQREFPARIVLEPTAADISSSTQLPINPNQLVEESPPPSPTYPYNRSLTNQRTQRQSSSEESTEPYFTDNEGQLQSALMQSYGEQDYFLREMTWPIPSCDVLLTDRDIAEGDNFIAEMEEKRLLYESMQGRLLSKLTTEVIPVEREIAETCDMITTLCQLHHFLYGGTEDELGIEFVPAENATDDSYILEQIESLTRRHHQELKSSDDDCAKQLLEIRGAAMTEQKLDSILEEHIKLRSYMRTRQTRDQIAAYNKVQSVMKENPSLHQASKQTPVESVKSVPATAVAAHPIVNRLPPISQNKLRAIGATRGRTQVVDQYGHLINPSQSNSDHADGNQPKLNNLKSAVAGNINSASIWARMPSEESEEEITTSRPVGSKAHQRSSDMETARAKLSSASRLEAGYKNSNSALVQKSGDDLMRTGVIAGSVSSKISQFSSTPAAGSWNDSDSSDSPSVSRKKATDHGDDVDYGDDFEDDDTDLLAQYQQTMKEGAGDSESEDSDSMVLSDKATSAAGGSSDAESEPDSSVQSKLLASANLKQELSEAIWEHQSEINPQSFHELISMWQSKQKDIVEKQEGGDKPSTGRAMWQKVKERLVYNAIAGASANDGSDREDSDDDESSSVQHSVSTSMQTSLPRGHSASVQTDSVSCGVDVETLVDQFLMDDQEKKKIKKLDKQLIEKLTSRELTDDELRRLLANNRENIDKLRKQREASRLKALQLLETKRNKKNERDEWDEDEQTCQNLEKIEQRVTNKLIKHKDQISDKDMKHLLAEARRQQEEILRQRKIERLRQNDKMREKLMEKRKAKLEAEQEETTSVSKLTDLESKFYDELKTKLASGQLTHEQFKALIDEHLSKMSGAVGMPAPAPRDSQDCADKEEHAIKAAQSIIRKGREKNKAIQDVRQRERQNALIELKQKKRDKRGKKMAES